MDGKFSPIVAVTDVLPQITKFTHTGFTTQSPHDPQTTHITTTKITAATIHCQARFFIPRLGVIVLYISRKNT
jgi:hypothetical protein